MQALKKEEEEILILVQTLHFFTIEKKRIKSNFFCCFK